MKLINITGLKFGRLTVISKLPPHHGGGSLWLCECECGNRCSRIGSQLRRAGATPSCGCYKIEWGMKMGSDRAFIAKRAAKVTQHGNRKRGATTPEYKTWLRMKSRCYRETDGDYPNWGGRGIRVCDRWLNNFAAFLADMGLKPSPKHTIDRLNSSLNYNPENCRWATDQEQGAENRRGFIAVTVDGRNFEKIADACRHFGLNTSTVNERLRAGIPIEQTFSPAGSLPSRRSKESYLRKDRR